MIPKPDRESDYPDVYLYPSFGNSRYPYGFWKDKLPESSWRTLELLNKKGHSMYRICRERYKWPPDVFDGIRLDRLLRIIEEIEEKKEDPLSENIEDWMTE